MYEHGKSDSPIVPEKLSNNGCDASQTAERAERRGLTKGNLFQQTELPDTGPGKLAKCSGTDTAGSSRG
jgi:hypothetical protein